MDGNRVHRYGEDEKAGAKQKDNIQSDKLFKAEVKLDMQLCDAENSSKKLDQWVYQIEVYFNFHHLSPQQISFARLKLVGHALTWYESYAHFLKIRKVVLVVKWEDLISLLQKHFYTIYHEEEWVMLWNHLKQEQGWEIQTYMRQLKKKWCRLGRT
ncbi:hypothetical protein SUGI_0309970 [Cryptomeria japonica]|nr:hypothetical protein SUGI_0309970 [Cryptomeria japonica]